MNLILSLSVVFFTAVGFAKEVATDPLESMQWLTGNWATQFSNNNLELNFSSSSGGVILSTYKIISPKDELIFMRFLSIIESNEQVQLHLYPFLNASPDVFLAEQIKESKIVFTRVYSNALCDVDSPEEALQDNEEKQFSCDRFPIQITFTKISSSTFEEAFYGFKPKGGEQVDVSFSRTYEKKTL